MNPLEAKKRALAAESEVYREMLKLELQNLRLYGVTAKRRLTRFTGARQLFLLLTPIIGSFFKRRRGPLLRQALLGLLSWQAWNRLLPFITGMLSSRGRNRPKPGRATEQEEEVVREGF